MGRYKTFLLSALIIVTISSCSREKSESSDDSESYKKPDETYATSIYVSGEDVYIGGYREKCTSWNADDLECSDTDSFPGYWKNGEWHPFNTHDGKVYSIAVSGSDIYCAGYILEGEKAVGGYWKNDTWVGLAAIDSSWNAVVKSIVISGSDVYAGGISSKCKISDRDFRGGGGVAVYWKNEELTSLSTVDSWCDSNVSSIVISGSDIYAGGYNAGEGSGYWKNRTWNTLCNREYNSSVTSLIVSGTDVYAGGYRNNIINFVGHSYPGYWKNGIWTGLVSYEPLEYDSQGFFSMALSGTDLYFGGYIVDEDKSYRFENVEGVAGYWKNGRWKKLASGRMLDVASQVLAIAVSGSDLYAAGFYRKYERVAVACYWKNGEAVYLKTEEWAGGGKQ